MGTDIFMEWDRQTEEASNKQIKSSMEIDKGYLGYLRASIGMTLENSILRVLFPEEYWRNTGKGLRFEFIEEKYAELLRAGYFYLSAIFLGREIKTEETEREKETQNKILESFKNAGFSEDRVVSASGLDFRDAVVWINSVFEFYELGMELEKKGLNPKVYISW